MSTIKAVMELEINVIPDKAERFAFVLVNYRRDVGERGTMNHKWISMRRRDEEEKSSCDCKLFESIKGLFISPLWLILFFLRVLLNAHPSIQRSIQQNQPSAPGFPWWFWLPSQTRLKSPLYNPDCKASHCLNVLLALFIPCIINWLIQPTHVHPISPSDSVSSLVRNTSGSQCFRSGQSFQGI